MIALGLAMGLLTVLTSTHYYMVALGVKAEREGADMHRRLLLHHRIGTFLNHVEAAKPFYFSQSDPYVGLVFTHDHGNDLNKAFSGSVLTRLFVYENQLWLATLPSPENWTEEQPPIIVELLAEKVTDFAVRFVDDKGQESSTWNLDRKELPGVVHIRMNIANQPYEQKVVFPKHSKVIEL